MPSWNEYTTDEVKVSSGGEIPVVEDGLYDAIITEVGEPETRPNPFPQRPGERFYEPEQTQFRIKFTLDDPALEPDTWFGYWINIPFGMRNGGHTIGERSKLFEVMTALGLMAEDKPTRFHPDEWVGLKARVMVEAIEGKDGVPRCRITAVKAPRGRKTVAAKPSLRERLTRDIDETE